MTSAVPLQLPLSLGATMRFVKSVRFEKIKSSSSAGAHYQVLPVFWRNMRKTPLIPARELALVSIGGGGKENYYIMDSPALVILGSSALKAGLWFAENVHYSVFLAGCREFLGNVITAVSSNILTLFASHTQERSRVGAVGTVFWSTNVLM